MGLETRACKAPDRRAPRLPRLVCLVDLDAACGREASGITSALLDDFEEATLVYARLSISELGEDDAPPCPAFARPEGARAREGAAAAGEARRHPDALVVAFSADGMEAPPEKRAEALAERIANALPARLTPPPRSRAYGICATAGADSAPACSMLGALGTWCGGQGLLWSGGVAVAGSKALEGALGTARMGVRRRYASEALDELVCAVRSGTDAGVIEARPGIAAIALGLLRRQGR